MRRPQAQDTTLDLGDEVERGKRERQAVLRRVRRQRAVVLRKLAVQNGSLDSDRD
jgi:hypothetical protein